MVISSFLKISGSKMKTYLENSSRESTGRSEYLAIRTGLVIEKKKLKKKTFKGKLN